MLRGSPEARAEGEQDMEAKGKAEGVPLTVMATQNLLLLNMKVLVVSLVWLGWVDKALISFQETGGAITVVVAVVIARNDKWRVTLGPSISFSSSREVVVGKNVPLAQNKGWEYQENDNFLFPFFECL